MRTVQQQLTMTTEGSYASLRSLAVGWSAEDPALFVPSATGHEGIGRTPRIRGAYTYTTPLAALADGWKLLAPPVAGPSKSLWDWWFVREVEIDKPALGVF